MTKIVLARHGIYYNPNKVNPFRSNDVSLSAEGISQIERNAKILLDFNISKIYSSPIHRCIQSSEIFSKTLNLPINIEEDLIETGSPLQNTPEEEYYKKLDGRSVYAVDYHLENGGETLKQIQERTSRILKKAIEENEGKSTLLVSHGDPLMILLAQVQGKSLDEDKKIEDQVDYIKKGEMIELTFYGLKLVESKKLVSE